MPGWESDPVIAGVRRSLGRSAPARSLPVPPAIDEPIVRLVHAEIGLGELFVKTANRVGIRAELVHADDVAGKISAELRIARVARVRIEPGKLLTNLGVPEALAAARVGATADAASVQIVVPYAAVAETGTVVFRDRPDRSISSQLLVVIEPRQLVPDLLDLFQKLSDDPDIRSTLLLSGQRPRISAYVLH